MQARVSKRHLITGYGTSTRNHLHVREHGSYVKMSLADATLKISWPKHDMHTKLARCIIISTILRDASTGQNNISAGTVQWCRGPKVGFMCMRKDQQTMLRGWRDVSPGILRDIMHLVWLTRKKDFQGHLLKCGVYGGSVSMAFTLQAKGSVAVLDSMLYDETCAKRICRISDHTVC